MGFVPIPSVIVEKQVNHDEGDEEDKRITAGFGDGEARYHPFPFLSPCQW